jgi:hypothetical protein
MVIVRRELWNRLDNWSWHNLGRRGRVVRVVDCGRREGLASTVGAWRKVVLVIIGTLLDFRWPRQLLFRESGGRHTGDPRLAAASRGR